MIKYVWKSLMFYKAKNTQTSKYFSVKAIYQIVCTNCNTLCNLHIWIYNFKNNKYFNPHKLRNKQAVSNNTFYTDCVGAQCSQYCFLSSVRERGRFVWANTCNSIWKWLQLCNFAYTFQNLIIQTASHIPTLI